MRDISKNAKGGGVHLAHEHAHPPQNSDDATIRWKRYQTHKAALLSDLLREQYHLCCYSEVRADLLQLGYHIEHVEPKSSNPQRTFDYQNLAASALESDDLHLFKVNNHEVFAGHAKLNYYDPLLFISCYQADCSRFFSYVSDGRIIPAKGLNAADIARAEYTIETLQLNSSYLIPLRQQWWDELDAAFTDNRQKNLSLEELVAIDLIPYPTKFQGPLLSQFFSLTRQFYGSLGNAVLAQRAPQLL